MIKQNKSWYIARRGELLAQEFLLELGAKFVASLQQSDIGLDYMAFFTKKDDEALTVIAIEVKATEHEVNGRYSMQTSLIRRLQTSNVPTLIIVADVKSNTIHFTWVHDAIPPERQNSLQQLSTCTVRLRRSTPDENENLKREILNFQLTNLTTEQTYARSENQRITIASS